MNTILGRGKHFAREVGRLWPRERGSAKHKIKVQNQLRQDQLALFQSKLIFGLVGPVIFHLHQTFKNSLISFKLRFGLVGTMEFMSPEVRLVFSKHKHRQTQCNINNDGQCFRWSLIKRPGLPAICGASGYVVRVV